MSDINVNDQVIVKKKVRTGNLIRFGSVVKKDGEKALVHFPIDHTQVVVPLEQLEKTSKRFGSYSRVQPSAVRRSFTNLQNWLFR
jgi:stalled ribosome alternative rescue factor ArfA